MEKGRRGCTSVVVEPPHVDDALLLFALEEGDAVQRLLGQWLSGWIPAINLNSFD